MRIKRLEIHGFKSFMDKTSFVFGDGMTAVVGPNGCGKSNIVDAMLWCMGEQSAKHLRGKDMQDVIFAGSESRPPAGMAEVSLFFTVADKPLPIDVAINASLEGTDAAPVTEGETAEGEALTPAPAPAPITLSNAVQSVTTTYSEIQVTRRLFRSGESEYLMNKTLCRLRDVQELFLDAGIGKGGYSIIEQGKVGMIVSSKPEDRRIFIEEAAGIAKFKTKKRQALQKMEQTEQNLLRVNDVVTELAKQMGSLERQAKKAERYRKLRDEIRDVDLKVAAAEHEKRTTELGAEQAALSELREREMQAAEEIASVEGAVEESRGRLAEDERELQGAQEALYAVNAEVKLDEQNLDYAVRELEKLKVQAETATADVTRLEGDVAQIDEDLARSAEEKTVLVADIDQKAGEIGAQAAALEASKAEQRRLLVRVDEVKGRIVEAMQMATSARNALVGLEKRGVDLRTRLDRGTSERDEVADRVEEARRIQNESTSALGELKQMKLGLEQQKQEQAALLETLRVELKTVEQEVKTLSDQLGKRKSRLQSLTELQNSYEGYQKGVRAVMARAGHEIVPLPDWAEEVPEAVPPLPEGEGRGEGARPEPPVEATALPTGPLSDGGASMAMAADGAAAVTFDSGAFPRVSVIVPAYVPAPVSVNGPVNVPVSEPEPAPAPGSSQADHLATATPSAIAPHAAGVFGLVADYLETPQRFETALEAVLGDRLQSVLVGCHTDGVDAISFLEEKSQGRGTFIPLDLAPAPETAFPDMEQPGVVGKLLDQVSAKPEFQRVARYLLGDVVVVESLDVAVRLHKAHRGLRKTFVTLKGDVVDAAGVMTGGSSEGLASGLLQRKREIKELAKSVAELEQSHAQKALAREQLAKRLTQVEEALKSIQKSEHEEAIRILHHEKDLSAVRERLERDRQRQEVLEFEAEQLRTALAEVGEEKAAAEQRVAEGTAAKEAADAELTEAQDAARGVSTEIEAMVAAETHLKVALAESRSRLNSLTANLERMARNKVDLEARIGRLREGIERSVADRANLQEEAERLGAAIDKKTKEGEELRLVLLERREKFDAEQLAMREREAAMKSTRARLQELRDGINGAQIRETELGMNIRHAVQGIVERYNEDLEAKWREWLDPALDFEAARMSVADLRERISKLGEVNMTAIEEHAEVAQRHDSLATQKHDLEQTLAMLKDTIAKINRTSKERFLETFEKVNAQFQEIFPKLFRGGKAYLTLTNEDDLLEAGIDIVAMPPGKKLQNINLLSGGEKALTAVALIVAIFMIRPTPFCLLDEVDAPLDEANVGRYNEIVREMSKNTQFIVITHNKKTMATCDALYGITMEEPGCSKMVSVKFNGAEMDRVAEAAS